MVGLSENPARKHKKCIFSEIAKEKELKLKISMLRISLTTQVRNIIRCQAKNMNKVHDLCAFEGHDKKGLTFRGGGDIEFMICF